MSLEIYDDVDTAEDLFAFLRTLSKSQRERLPISIVVNDTHDAEGDMRVEAFEVTETEGCTVRGLRISNNS